MATVCVCTMHVHNLMLLVFNVKSTDTSQTYNMTLYISYHTSRGVIINHLRGAGWGGPEFGIQ